MKAPLFGLATAALLALTLSAPNPAQAAQVFVDLHFGIPIVAQRPHVVYEPVAVYRPRVVCPPPVVYYRPHHHHYAQAYYSAPIHQGYEPSYGRGGYIAEVQIDERLRR